MHNVINLDEIRRLITAVLSTSTMLASHWTAAWNEAIYELKHLVIPPFATL